MSSSPGPTNVKMYKKLVYIKNNNFSELKECQAKVFFENRLESGSPSSNYVNVHIIFAKFLNTCIF